LTAARAPTVWSIRINKPQSSFISIFALLAVAFLFGCAKSKSAPQTAANTQSYYAVKTAEAAFYRYGPQQANGPDRKLPKDTLMTIGKPRFGYLRVKLTTGEEGFMSRDDLEPASPELVAKIMPTPTPRPAYYAEPKLPTLEATPAVEPTAIPMPSGSPL
jgi:hypothetical protein